MKKQPEKNVCMHHRNMQDCMGINCIETLVACIESSVGGSNWNVNKKSETPPCMKKKLAMTVIKKISGDISDHQSMQIKEEIIESFAHTQKDTWISSLCCISSFRSPLGVPHLHEVWS